MGYSFDTCDMQLAEIASLVRQRNSIDARIGDILDRPASVGNIGEWIAAKVFDIELAGAANNAAFDGYFTNGPLTGRTVNIKAYGRQESLLDVTENPTLDYYLVLTGPKGTPPSLRKALRPFCIESVYLFDAVGLLAALEATGVKIVVATSIRAAQWNAAEIYPRSANPSLIPTDRQRTRLAMFRAKDAGDVVHPRDEPVATADREFGPSEWLRVYDNREQPGPMGVDSHVTVFANFTATQGLMIDGSDSVQWPLRDLDWKVRVGADQTEQLLTALGAQSVDDIVEIVAERFGDGTFRPVPSGLDQWLTKRGVRFSRSESWLDN